MEALVGMAAQSFVSSATGNNCQVGTVQSPSGQSRRWEGPFLEDRASGPGTSGDPGAETQQNVTVCNMGNFVGPQYYAQGWRQAAGPGPAAFVDVEASYQVSSTLDTELLCDFFEAALLIIEADYTPELMRLDYKIDKKAGRFSPTPLSLLIDQRWSLSTSNLLFRSFRLIISVTEMACTKAFDYIS